MRNSARALALEWCGLQPRFLIEASAEIGALWVACCLCVTAFSCLGYFCGQYCETGGEGALSFISTVKSQPSSSAVPAVLHPQELPAVQQDFS